MMLKPTARETILQLTRLVELSTILNSSLDQAQVRRQAMEAVKALLDCEASSLLLLDERAGELFFEVAVGKRGDRVKQTRLQMGEGIAGWVAKTGEPLLIHDVSRDPRHARKVDEHSRFSTRNMVCAPVKVRERVIGVLQGINKTKGVFYKQDLELLVMLSNQVGIAMDHARLYEAIQETFLENVEANKMLGLTFQSKGMLDLALERFLKVPLDGEMLEVLYQLSFDFERMRVFDKAREVCETIARRNPSFRDIQARLKMLGDPSQNFTSRTSRLVTSRGAAKGSTQAVEPRAGGPAMGRYEILEEMGKGSLGRVFKGRDPRIQRLVALKTLEWTGELAPEEQAEVTRLFLREVEAAGRLSHTSIVVIFDAGEDLGIPYVAMEFLEGSPLDRWFQKGNPMPVAHVAHLGVQVCQALAYAHGLGVLHGDIKPSNLFLLPRGRVKITDFGTGNVASRIRPPGEEWGPADAVPFLPPEVILGEPTDERSDLYSFGVLLYGLLTARLPFHHERTEALLEQMIIRRATPLRRIRPDVPGMLEQLVDRLLSKEPDARFASAREVEESLLAVSR
jgi:serine/threonine-protein kinase